MADKEAVKEGDSAGAKAVDERGVPWENRAKETERKLKEMEAKIQDYEARFTSLADAEPQPSPQEEDEARKQRIASFVENPDGYIESRIAQREMAKEIPAAEEWLKGQKGFNAEDEAAIIRIIKEHGLSQPSPMARAKTAWHLLQAERLEKELSLVKGDKKREDSVRTSMPDGTSRSQSPDGSPKRADLIKQLAEAEKRRDKTTSMRILDQLEDAR